MSLYRLKVFKSIINRYTSTINHSERLVRVRPKRSGVLLLLYPCHPPPPPPPPGLIHSSWFDNCLPSLIAWPLYSVHPSSLDPVPPVPFPGLHQQLTCLLCTSKKFENVYRCPKRKKILQNYRTRNLSKHIRQMLLFARSSEKRTNKKIFTKFTNKEHIYDR